MFYPLISEELWKVLFVNLLGRVLPGRVDICRVEASAGDAAPPAAPAHTGRPGGPGVDVRQALVQGLRGRVSSRHLAQLTEARSLELLD